LCGRQRPAFVPKKKDQQTVFDADQPLSACEIDIENLLVQGTGAEKRARGNVEARSGRCRSAAPVKPDENAFDLALDATLKQAALRLARSGGVLHERPVIAGEDLCKKQRYRPRDNLIVLVVDSSDSMGDGTEARMKAAKGAVMAILRKAHQNRSKVALIAFGGEQAKVVLAPTRSISLARQKLESLPTGGATPFADGLLRGWRLIQCERLKNPGVRPVLVIISDGEANVPLTAGTPTLKELFAIAGKIGQERIVSVLIDVASKSGKLLEMHHLATQLRAAYLKVSDLRSRHILKAVSAANERV
jgi:Mg-chelatase subunit ChlD